jgi:phosphatidylglycerophosphatase A
VAAWSLLASLLNPEWRAPVAVLVAAAVTAAGIPAATRVARAASCKDPAFVVIDEVAGQMIALVALPLSWKSALASLILFRVFDIVKPPPLRRLERLPGGAGILLDDVGAGLYALAVAQLLLGAGLLT